MVATSSVPNTLPFCTCSPLWRAIMSRRIVADTDEQLPCMAGSIRSAANSSMASRVAGAVGCALLVGWIWFPSLFYWVFWTLLSSLKALGWLVSVVLFGVWWAQGHILYLPNMQGRKWEKRRLCYNQPAWRTPDDVRLPFENLFVQCEDGISIHAWLVTQPEVQRRQCPTLLYFHGNAGNIGYRLSNIRDLYYHTGANIMVVEYRGYGNSFGSPSEQGLIRDGKACVNYLKRREDINSRLIVVFGRSLGGAVGIAVSQACPLIRALIVENTFTSIADMALVIFRLEGHRHAPLLRRALSGFLTSPWDSKTRMRDLHLPVLLLSGRKDELIPPSQMDALLDAAASQKEMFQVSEGEHNNTFERGGTEYYEAISKFLTGLNTTRAGASIPSGQT